MIEPNLFVLLLFIIIIVILINTKRVVFCTIDFFSANNRLHIVIKDKTHLCKYQFFARSLYFIFAYHSLRVMIDIFQRNNSAIVLSQLFIPDVLKKLGLLVTKYFQRTTAALNTVTQINVNVTLVTPIPVPTLA